MPAFQHTDIGRRDTNHLTKLVLREIVFMPEPSEDRAKGI